MSVTEIDSSLAIQIINKLDEQAKFSQEQAKFSQEQAKFVAEKFDAIERELGQIKANTVIIMGRVVSDFEGIQPDTKAEIEQLASECEKHVQEIVEYPELVAQDKTVRKEAKAFTTGMVLAEWNPSATKAERNALGNWVGSQMSKIFGIKFGGRYHPLVRPLVAQLVAFWVAERVTNGRMY